MNPVDVFNFLTRTFFIIPVTAITIIVLCVKAFRSAREKTKGRTKKLVAWALVIAIIMPYLMFFHGSIRPTAFSTKNISQYYDELSSKYNECKEKTNCEKIIYSSKKYGNLSGSIEVHGGRELPQKEFLDKHSEDDEFEYLFTRIRDGRDDLNSNLCTPTSYSGEIYIYNKSEKKTVIVDYSFYGIFYILNSVSAFYPGTKHNCDDVLESAFYGLPVNGEPIAA